MEFREIPRNSGKNLLKNTAEFREILLFFKKFRILPEVKKALPWTPYPEVDGQLVSSVKR
jgi:hypothetical protein